ncbi:MULTISPECIES: hypothetical protein [unclassified Streptomyces]|uniref:hypothetical protein n=1 Tax=unclassified Streptomyces TaxID=2593676 RepID=UPI0033A207CE
MCAKCDYDLRQHDDERLPYNIPLPEKPSTIRLLCGPCCNDGEDEMDRRAALARQPS